MNGLNNLKRRHALAQSVLRQTVYEGVIIMVTQNRNRTRD